MTANVCPTCGIEIPAYAPAGLCPRCLMNGGLESGALAREGIANGAVAATLASPHPTPPGSFVPPELAELNRRFPQLEILELIGKGGMGAVYKARQRGLDRLVALKILPPEIGNDPAFAERFGREARALGRLSHPNIVGVYDFGQVDGLFYFLMEYIDGANLRQAIRAGGITSKDALSIVGQVCDALQFAHDEAIVHRDIKPENILIDKRGRVKIADFGLAKLLGNEQADHGLTATHQVMGTLRYMAPEQMAGAKEVDHRADIFSLGVVFYELLTGELPVGRFAVPSKTVGVDVRLDEVVLRALEREPQLRYQQASEVKTQVQAISDISPLVARHLFGREYRTKAEIFGWPLVHIATGLDAKTGKRKIARGVIAIGETAIGGLAIGGGAIGVIACGGVALGLISFGGLSIGLLLAVGGLAMGNFALGGMAIGTVAAGGCAVGYYAYGGAALGNYTLTGEYQHPEATKLFDRFARSWRLGLMLLLLASPAFFGLISVVIWLAMWGQASDEEPSRLDSRIEPRKAADALAETRQQLVNVGRILVALGIVMLVAWFPITLILNEWGDNLMVTNKTMAESLFPYFYVQMVFPFIGGPIVIRSGWNLMRLKHVGFAKFGVVLCMIPLSAVALVGLPFGLWALAVLGKRETTLLAEEEKRLREKQEIADRAALRDQESMWHDLGVILGYFLRDNTVRMLVGGAAMLVYVLCLIMIFSIHAGTTVMDGVTISMFEAGQPTPWFVVKSSLRGQSMLIVWNSWPVALAIVGVFSLLLARKMEELRYGKVHSIIWHYVVWAALAGMVLIFGGLTMVSSSQKPMPATNVAPTSVPLATVLRGEGDSLLTLQPL